MQEVKHCKRFGCVIALEAEADYYSYIRIKYCKPCRAAVQRMQRANRQYRFRQRRKEAHRLTKEQNQLLREENELLRRRLICLREQEDIS